MLDVQNLKTQFFTRAGIVYAVDDVSFAVGQGETLGIVGRVGLRQERDRRSASCGSIPSPPGKIVGGADPADASTAERATWSRSRTTARCGRFAATTSR